jgi:NTE family protein
LTQPDGRPSLAGRPAAPRLVGAVARRPWRYRPGVLAAALLPAGTREPDPVAARLGPLFGAWPDDPMWICTVRLDDGARVVFGRDRPATVSQAVAASCAIPGYFAPVEVDGHRYVDGGAWSVHNLDLVAGLGLDLVVVSAPMSTADSVTTDPGNLLRLPVRRRLSREVETVRAAGTPVFVVQPDAGLRSVMGTNSMVLAKRAPVARAAFDLASAQLRRETPRFTA